MNLKLFSLISSDDIPATKLQIKISGSLNAFTDDDVSFKRFSSLKEMFPSLGKALADSELIVIAVDPKIYVRTKTLLTKALSLDIEENPTVKKALGRAAEIPDSQKLLQSQMPKGAVPFLTRDGVNSGFVISKGHQQIMYLPLDDARLDTVLRNGVIPYLTSGETIAVREEAYAPKNTTVKPSVPPKRQEAPAPEKTAQSAGIQSGSQRRHILRQSIVFLMFKQQYRNSGLTEVSYIFFRKADRTDNNSIILAAYDLRNKLRCISVGAKRNQKSRFIRILIHLADNSAEIFIRDLICNEKQLITSFSF